MFSLFMTGIFAGNLGDYYPFPEQEKVVAVFFDNKEIWAVTKSNIFTEVKGFFSSKYHSTDSIFSAVNYNNEIWIGTNKGLLRFNKENAEITKVTLPDVEEAVIVDLFPDRQNHIWICTKDKGVFSTDENGEIILQTKKEGIVSGDMLTTGTVGLVGTTGFHYFLKSFWHSFPTESYLQGTDSDSIQDMFVDANGYFWVISKAKTNVYELQSSVGKADTLLLRNSFKNNGNRIIDFTYIPDLGVLFATQNGIYFNYRAISLNPLLEFDNTANTYTLDDLLKKDVSTDFARTTGYRRADIVRYDPDAKKVWFVNANGAIGVKLKDMKEFLL